MKINNQNKYYQLVQFVTENLKSHEIVKEYKNNNINKYRLETYRDFIINLCYKTVTTYLGDEYITTQKQRKEHFKWAFDKVCGEFNEEGLNFKKNIDLFDYFFEYYNSTIYENEDYELDFLLDYWEETLEYSLDKTKSDLEGMIEVYKIFDKSIDNKIKNDIQYIFDK